jgi:uncharacterized protein (TIGR03067 family)
MLDGTWIPVEAELGGTKLGTGALSNFQLVIHNNHYEVPGDVGRIELISAEDKDGLHAMDVIGTDGANKGKTFPAVYTLDGDTLRICYDLSGKARPAALATEQGTRLFLVQYARKQGSRAPAAPA